MNERFGFRHAVTACIAIIMVFMFAGCATTPLVKDKAEKFYPPPPEQPRIKFVDYYSDVWHISKKGQTWAESMFGKTEERLFRKPYGIAVSPDGTKVYVTDVQNMMAFDLEKGEFINFADSMGTGPGALTYPFGVMMTKNKKLYVTDITRKRVIIYDQDGKYQSVIGTDNQLMNPTAVAVDEERNLVYVVDSKAHNLKVYNTEGKLQRTIGGKTASFEDGHFNFPSNVMVSPEGEVYVVDSGNFRIQVFGPEGEFRRKWGRVGDMPGEFARPRGIAMDSEGHVYVVDAAFQNIQVFSKEGRTLMWFGFGGPELGNFRLPAGIAIDSSDRVFTVEQVRPRVQIFQFLGRKYWEANQKEKADLERRLGKTFSLVETVEPPPPAADSASQPAAEDKAAASVEQQPDGKAVEEKPLNPQADLLVRMIEVKYGKLSSEHRARIEKAYPDMLLKWGVRVFSAEKIEQVFGE
ncbi:MAG: hypothetical protein HZA20_02585 [Nitrospirae bacterium]|nr:hypothetical protein [Nitrospirota bacterium]